MFPINPRRTSEPGSWYFIATPAAHDGKGGAAVVAATPRPTAWRVSVAGPGLLALGAAFGVGMTACADVPDETTGSLYVVEGKVYDDTNAPLEGARVSVGGVEAIALTDSTGGYRIESPFPFEDSVDVAISRPGMESYVAVQSILRLPDSVPHTEDVSLKTAAGPQMLEVTAPQAGSTWQLNASCTRRIDVTGVVSYAPRDNVRTDLMITIDRSGSTSRAFDSEVTGGPTVFDQELEAAFELLDSLNPSVTRVSVMAFATDASTPTAFTTDYSAVRAELEKIRAEGPETIGTSTAATHYQAAMDAARTAFLTSPLTVQNSNTLETEDVETLRALVFLSDGIPTLPVAPGATQEKGDIQASLAAAHGLAEASIKAFTYAVGIPSATANLTTLHSIATITGGAYQALDNPDDVTEIIPSASLVHMGMVRVGNLATGDVVQGMTTPDGFFSLHIPVQAGAQTLQISALDEQGVSAIQQERVVTGIQGVDNTVPQGLASQSVAQQGLMTPTGHSLGDNDLYEYLISQEKDFPDAIESLGTEVWGVMGTTGDTIVRGEYTYREACWNSDIGYLLVDPNDLAHSTRVALAAATSQNLLFNTGSATTNCNQQYIPGGMAGAAFSINVPAGSALVFFLVQNGRLADGQAGNKTVIYTVSSLNPGGYDQVLSYYSEKGRQGKSALPQVVLAWEDMTLSCGADQDYDDVIFTLEGVVPAAPITTCTSSGDSRDPR